MKSKINEHGIKFVLSEIPNLINEELLDVSSGERLTFYYKKLLAQKGENKSRLLTMILISFCALLVGGGCCMIIAHNWDKYGILPRLIIAFTPLIIGSILSIISLNKSPVWREAAGILQGLAIGGSIAIVAQVYNLGGTVFDFLQIWFLLLIPFMFVLRSNILTLMGCALYFSYLITFAESRSSYVTFALPSLLFLVPFSLLVWKIVKEPSSHIATVFRYCLLIMLLQYFLIITDSISDSVIGCSLIISVVCGLFVWGVESYKATRFFANPFMIAGYITILIILCNFCNPGDHFDLYDFDNENSLSKLVVIGILGVVSWVYIALKIVNNRSYWYGFLLVIILMMTMHNDVTQFTLTGLSVVIGLYGIISGVKNRSMLAVDGGIGVILGLILVYFFSSQLSILTRGIVFIIIGLLFGVLNLVLIKKFKAIQE